MVSIITLTKQNSVFIVTLLNAISKKDLSIKDVTKQNGYLLLKKLTVRRLPVPELIVKSDSIYLASLWLRNLGPSRRILN